MTNELEPCPFHKEPIYPILTFGFDRGNGNPDSGGFYANLECPECGNGFSFIECESEDQALNRVKQSWNARYKRTCKEDESE